MKFGVCTTADNWAAAAAAGCDYGELSFQSVAGMEQEAFDGLCAQIGQSGFASEVMNSFLPGSCRLTGDAADHEAALAFAEAGFDRAAQAGAKVVVFGSGMARQVPEGFSVREAAGQVSAFAGKAAALAAQRGIVLAIEPLGTGECNLIHTVSEALEICALAGNPENLAVLADLYHMHHNKEDFAGVLAAGSRLAQCHIAAPCSRVFCAPGQAALLYRGFFGALKAIGYAGRLSVEGQTNDFAADTARAMTYLRGLWEE